MTLFVSETLTDLITNEPGCSVAIIAKTQESAERIYQALEHLPKIRLITDGDFEFKPGIDVVEATQVKGLEFDYVIVPDASAGVYRDLPEHRRLLHVALTRAIHQLWVISISKASPILPKKS